jgi:hypothetical protein
MITDREVNHNFGDGDLASFTNLSRLKKLWLASDALTTNGLTVLSSMTGLTNVSVTPKYWPQVFPEVALLDFARFLASPPKPSSTGDEVTGLWPELALSSGTLSFSGYGLVYFSAV